ncbi:MbcA/ParS/Xre antitoxin family protein [Jannaschia rubra]|uniref:MbcA/ParS/Xre antitoxin family protein n=1 Tax=Jannaschia rubra TaxID=282197 RepID=UPI00248F5061|nr:MbcA/ParS/Xre antitoxin family protein [Jannaschia rubra]
MLQPIPMTPAAPARPDLTPEESAAAARAVVNLFRLWGLDDAEARACLGGLPARTWARWKTGATGRIDRDLATRLSLFLGVHKALRGLFGTDSERVHGWMRRPNAAFGGRSALAMVTEGQMLDLYRLRHYLDAERAG